MELQEIIQMSKSRPFNIHDISTLAFDVENEGEVTVEDVIESINIEMYDDWAEDVENLEEERRYYEGYLEICIQKLVIIEPTAEELKEFLELSGGDIEISSASIDGSSFAYAKRKGINISKSY